MAREKLLTVIRFAGRLNSLAVILFIAAALRLVAVNWGGGHPIHPDERHVIDMAAALSWQDPNPHDFAYGSLPLYVLRATARVAALTFDPFWESYHELILLGRLLSTLAALLTIALVFVLGREMFDRRVGLLAAALLSLTVLHIQQSHYYTVDQLLVFFTTAAFWAYLRMARHGAASAYLLGGILAGMAVATKLSALPLGLVLLVAHLLNLVRLRRWVDPSWLLLALSFVAAYLTFYVCEPYAFSAFRIPWDFLKNPQTPVFSTAFLAGFCRALFSPKFVHDYWEYSNVARGVSQHVCMAIYENTTPYVYQLRQLLAWGMGPPLGLASLAGTVYLAILALRGATAWARGAERDKALAILVPSLLLLSWLLPYAFIIGGFKVKFLRYLAPLLPFWCLAASKFLFDLRKAKTAWVARLGRWAIGLTLAYAVFYALAYTTIFFRPHTHIQASKWFARKGEPNAKILQEHWDEVLPFPLANSPVFTAAAFPSYDPDSPAKVQQLSRLLAGNDYLFCSSDRIYGTILSWQERWPLTSRLYKRLFAGELGYELIARFSVTPKLLGVRLDDRNADESFKNYDHPVVLVFKNRRKLDAERLAALIQTPSPRLDGLSRAGALDLLPRGSDPQHPGAHRSNFSQALIWWLSISTMGWIAFPLCFACFRGMPDRGLSASKTLGILALSYVVWFTSMQGWTEFTRPWIVALALLLGAVSLLFWCRQRQEILSFLKSQRRLAMTWELSFLAIGAAFLLVRAYNPEIYWGEKPMDFSFLNLFMRTETFPPPDPWFAGAPLNYYYFGFVMVATAGKLLGVEPGILYNLATATIPAQVFLLVLGIAATFTRRLWFCLLAAVFVVLLGNLAWPLEVYSGHGIKGGFELFWATSRVIKGAAIEEYPLWTFLFADLHGHMMAMPACLLALYSALALLVPHFRRAGSRAGAAILCSLALGSLFVTNVWDFICYTLILGGLTAGLDLAGREASAWRNVPGRFAGALLKGVVLALAVAGGGLALFYPYFETFRVGSTYLGVNRDGFVPLRDVLILFGQFLWIHWMAMVLVQFEGRTGPNGQRHRVLLGASFLWAAGVIAVLALGLDARPHVTTVFCLALAVLAAGTAVLAERRRAFVHGWLLLCLGAVLLALPELFTMADRLNTIFKIYNTVWYMLAISAGACLFRALLAARDVVSDPRRSPRDRRMFRATVTGGLLVTAGLLGIAAYSVRVDVRGVTEVKRVPPVRPTIDGTAYLARKFPDDARGIKWLNQHVRGLATVLEATGPPYQDFTRVNMNTGLTTVLGWDSHVRLRGQPEAEVRRREKDIAAMYTSQDPVEVRALLERYKVDYVFVGELEIRVYGPGVLQQFDAMPELIPVFSRGKTRIYRVARDGTVAASPPISEACSVARTLKTHLNSQVLVLNRLW